MNAMLLQLIKDLHEEVKAKDAKIDKLCAFIESKFPGEFTL